VRNGQVSRIVEYVDTLYAQEVIFGGSQPLAPAE
jgi:ketosteroid isomerase-like protein